MGPLLGSNYSGGLAFLNSYALFYWKQAGTLNLGMSPKVVLSAN